MSSITRTLNNSHQFDLIFSSLANSIGNSTYLKCIIIDDKPKFSKCWSYILNEMIILSGENSNPFVDLLNKIVQEYHRKHKAGCKTLICLTILLWKRINDQLCLPSKDIDTILISKLLSRILKESINEIRDNKNCIKQLPLNNSFNISTLKIKSRHFLNDSDCKNLTMFSNNEHFYKNLLLGLSRNNQVIADLLWNLVLVHETHNIPFKSDKILITTPQKSQFKRKPFKINESSLVNPLDYLIERGVLLEINEQFLYQTNEFTGVSLNGILIDSSLEHKYVHLGYNKDLKCQIINDNYNLGETNDYDIWLRNFQENIKNANVNVIFVSGSIDYNLKNWLDCNSIIIFDTINYKTFEMLKAYFNQSALVYLNDLTADYIFKCKIDKLTSSDFFSLKYIVVKPVENIDNQTISLLFKSRLECLTKMYEDDLEHCVKRIENVINNRVFIEGSAKAEEFLSTSIMCQKLKLKDFIDTGDNDIDIYYELVKSALYNGFMDFVKLVNHQKQDETRIYYDDFSEKTRVWDTAVRTVCLLLNTDEAFF